MPSISFIIPTYNGLNLLKRCLKSIENQIKDTDKIIIINDGSTDGTKEFLFKNYSEKNNVIVINQDNLGSGPARNTGLIYSDTEYVWFIDSDDYILDNAVDLVRRKLSESKNDVLFIGHIMKKRDGYKRYNLKFNPNNKNEVLLTQYYPWNKVIKRSLFNEVRFPNEKIRYQDVATIPRILLYADNIGILNEELYCYDFSHSQNITKNVKKEKEIFTACDYLVKNLKEKYYDELELILFHLLIFNRLYFSPEDNFKSTYTQIKEIKTYFDKNAPNWKKSKYLKSEFGRKYNKFIPFLKIKIMVGNILKNSTRFTALIVYIIIKFKPFIKKKQ